MQGWLIAVDVAAQDMANIRRVDARITQTAPLELAAEPVRVYSVQDAEPLFRPSLTLYEDGTFQMIFSPVSSYIGVGTYERSDERLTLHTDDGKFTYTFDVVEDALRFDADASSEWLWFADLQDGDFFS